MGDPLLESEVQRSEESPLPTTPASQRRLSVRRWNSTLKVGKPLKRRDFRKRKEGRYGPLWEKVRRMPCFLLEMVPELHECGLGYAPATAHHVIPKGLDEQGLLPVCGKVHDVLEAQKRREIVDFTLMPEYRRGSWIMGVRFEVDVRLLGLHYVERAKGEDLCW